MSRSGLVSIGLPVFNGEQYLRSALDAALGQTYGDFELIISDNASTDNTIPICEEYARSDSRIRLLRQSKNLGVNANHEVVFRESRGEFFRWSSADDIPSLQLVKHAVDVLNDDKSLVAYVPDTVNVGASGERLKHFPKTLDLRSDDPIDRAKAVMTRNYQMVFTLGLMRRSTLMTTSRDWSYFGWDFILLFELALRGQLSNIDGPLLQRRIHEESAAHSTTKVSEVREWVDPSLGSKVLLPHWKWVGERTRAVANAPLTISQKSRVLSLVFRNAWWSRQALLRDIVMSTKLAFGKTDEYPF